MIPVRERELADPLSAVTRTERRWVLVTNLILFSLVYGELVPSKISAFGIEITRTNSRVLIAILIAVAYYFLLSFLIYHAADRRAWEAEKEDTEKQQAAETKGEEAVLTVPQRGGHAAWRKSPDGRMRAHAVYQLRRYFEFWVPAILGSLNPVLCFARMFWMA